MLKVYNTNRFEKDLKKVMKRKKDFKKLLGVTQYLKQGKRLPERCKDHALQGKYVGRRECHIEPDWLLVYKIVDNIVWLERTGTHSDLFN